MRAVTVDLADQALRARYDALFEACPRAFIQQSTDWAEVIAELGPDTPIFLLCEAEGADVAGLPLYLYAHPFGHLLTSVPQAGPLGGVFARGDLAPEQREAAYRCLLDAAVALAERHRCVALTVITDPFSKDDLDRYTRCLGPTLVLENFTQWIPLDRPLPRSHGHRNNLNRAARAGTTVEVGTREDLTAWYGIHRGRHAALGAPPLPRRLFENIFDGLVPRGKAEFLVARSAAGLVAGAVYICHRDVTDVFMLSADSEHLASGASFLLTDRSLDRAQARGARIYNWQSSPSRDSGVYRYKQQWGSLETDYYFLTRLFCSPEYLARLGLDTVRAAYPGHYVVPYGAFERGFDARHFRKD